MRPKRSLGQNFLKDPAIAERMAEFARISQTDTVLEIGPGKGMLTGVLLRHAGTVIAMEKDDSLFELLQGRYRGLERIRIVHEDILECDLSRVIQDNMKIVSNLPYNIGTQLIIRLAEHARRIACVVVMLQKEVAQRICARAGDKEYSALSLIVQAGFDAEPGFIVGPRNFYPRPKVDSQALKLVPAVSPIPLEDREVFKRVVWAAFHQRRKVLRNTLLQLPRMDAMLLEAIAQRCGINLRSRPQEITAGQYHLFSQAYRQSIDGTQA